MENEDIVYSVMEAAKLLKVGKNKVYALIKAGLLPALNLGGIKIRRQTLLNFLEIYENYDLTDVNNIVPFNCAATA